MNGGNFFGMDEVLKTICESEKCNFFTTTSPLSSCFSTLKTTKTFSATNFSLKKAKKKNLEHLKMKMGAQYLTSLTLTQTIRNGLKKDTRMQKNFASYCGRLHLKMETTLNEKVFTITLFIYNGLFLNLTSVLS
jgi:hypothetical protein